MTSNLRRFELTLILKQTLVISYKLRFSFCPKERFLSELNNYISTIKRIVEDLRIEYQNNCGLDTTEYSFRRCLASTSHFQFLTFILEYELKMEELKDLEIELHNTHYNLFKMFYLKYKFNSKYKKLKKAPEAISAYKHQAVIDGKNYLYTLA